MKDETKEELKKVLGKFSIEPGHEKLFSLLEDAGFSLTAHRGEWDGDAFFEREAEYERMEYHLVKACRGSVTIQMILFDGLASFMSETEPIMDDCIGLFNWDIIDEDGPTEEDWADIEKQVECWVDSLPKN